MKTGSPAKNAGQAPQRTRDRPKNGLRAIVIPKRRGTKSQGRRGEGEKGSEKDGFVQVLGSFWVFVQEGEAFGRSRGLEGPIRVELILRNPVEKAGNLVVLGQKMDCFLIVWQADGRVAG